MGEGREQPPHQAPAVAHLLWAMTWWQGTTGAYGFPAPDGCVGQGHGNPELNTHAMGMGG